MTKKDAVTEYLKRLKRVARDLPRSQREEMLTDIHEHLSAATAEATSDAAVLSAIERLGPPEAIVADLAPAPKPLRSQQLFFIATALAGLVIALTLQFYVGQVIVVVSLLLIPTTRRGRVAMIAVLTAVLVVPSLLIFSARLAASKDSQPPPPQFVEPVERRYDLNLWIGHPFGGATYLPR